MKLHADSHRDHHLTADQMEYLLARFADRSAFFIETVELPAELGTVPCGLYGPTMGDPPVPDDQVTLAKRGDRPYKSRLVNLPVRPTRMVTVIAGGHTETCPTCGGRTIEEFIEVGMAPVGTSWICQTCKGTGKVTHACILYTAFGGPQAPQEPADIRRQLEAAELERRERDTKVGDPAAHHVFVNVPGTDEYLAERASVDPIYARIVALRGKRAVSDAFWRDHALAK